MEGFHKKKLMYVHIKKKIKPPERGVALCPLIKLLWLDIFVWSIKILYFANTKFKIIVIIRTKITVPTTFIRYINTFYSVLPEPKPNQHLSYL